MSDTLAQPGAASAAHRPDEPAGAREDAWGVDLDHLDSNQPPGDDFFAYVNRKWIEAHPIPAQLTTISNFTLLVERNRASLRTLIEDLASGDPAPGSDERRLVDAWHAFLDAGALARTHPDRPRPWLDRIERARDLEELVAVTAEPGLAPLIGLGIMADPAQPQAHVAATWPVQAGLPARDLYLGEDERSRSILASYLGYLSLLLGHAGYGDPAALAERVLAFEREAAVLHWPRESLRNPDLAWTGISPAQFAAQAPAFPAARLLEASGFGRVDKLLAGQWPRSDPASGGLPAIMDLIARTPLTVLKAHCAAQFLNQHADILGDAIDGARYDLYERQIRGRAEPLERWKRAVTALEAQLGDCLGARYVAQHFPPDSKAQIDALVGNLLAALRESIEFCAWMGSETRAEALAKLDGFDTQIGHGARFETYPGLEIVPDDPLANAMAAARWRHANALARLARPVERSEWPFVAQTVNATYRAERNQIVFPAGILQPPFFDPAADPAVNYGAIGAVIGHEIAHGFDDQGSKSDGRGALRNWWQPEDRARFDALTAPLIAQYEACRPLDHDPSVRINGRLSLGENIADLAGLELAWRAWRRSLNGTEAPVIDGFTGDQRFFLAFAQVWRGTQREAALRNHLATAPHSPARFRVNQTLSNVDAWYRAFGVGPDAKGYIPPHERVHIWASASPADAVDRLLPSQERR
jgi:putative endopeptidase